MDALSVTFTGRTPLVVHNIRLANPLDPYTKAIKQITSKRRRTEEDHLEMLRLEWEGGLYFDDDLGPYLPVSYPTACLKQAGAITREKTAVARAVTVMALDGGDRLAIEYNGPRAIDEMWADDAHRDVRLVKVGQARTVRSRPRFPVWAVQFVAVVDTEILDIEAFGRIARRAGRNIGLGEAPEGARARFDATAVALDAERVADLEVAA